MRWDGSVVTLIAAAIGCVSVSSCGRRTAASIEVRSDWGANLSKTPMMGTGSFISCRRLFCAALLCSSVMSGPATSAWKRMSHSSMGRRSCSARLNSREMRRQLGGWNMTGSPPPIRTNLVSFIHASPPWISSPIPSVRSP